MNLSNEKKYQLLVEISQKIRDTLDLDEIMEHILDTIGTVLEYNAGGIFVLNEDLVHQRRQQPKEMIAGMIQRGFDPQPSGKDAMFNLGKGIIGHVIFSNTSVVAPDVRLDPHYLAGRSRTRSEIAVPIVRNDRAIGALNLENDRLSAYGEEDLELLQFFADAAAIAIEKAMLHRQILEKELIDKQLQLAREMQFRLFPDEPPQLEGYDLAGICIPAEEIGGDYFDFIKLPHGAWGVTVADVSGNGIAAGLIMTSFRGLLRTHTRGKLSPAKIARAINRQLPDFIGNNSFITAVYVDLDHTRDEFTYVSCGHHPPLLLGTDGIFRQLDIHGPVLGVFKRVDYSVEKLPLLPGDILVLYTDGVVEIYNAAGEEYGIERLQAAINRVRALPSEEIIQSVIRETQEFSGSQLYQDDFTLVIIKRH